MVALIWCFLVNGAQAEPKEAKMESASETFVVMTFFHAKDAVRFTASAD